jgi:hypothetical protein
VERLDVAPPDQGGPRRDAAEADCQIILRDVFLTCMVAAAGNPLPRAIRTVGVIFFLTPGPGDEQR